MNKIRVVPCSFPLALKYVLSVIVVVQLKIVSMSSVNFLEFRSRRLIHVIHMCSTYIHNIIIMVRIEKISSKSKALLVAIRVFVVIKILTP